MSKTLFAFGDSLSDAGNDYYVDGGTDPVSSIYYQGHFSNGLTWVEDLSNMLGLGTLAPSLKGGTTSPSAVPRLAQPPLKAQIRATCSSRSPNTASSIRNTRARSSQLDAETHRGDELHGTRPEHHGVFSGRIVQRDHRPDRVGDGPQRLPLGLLAS
jgi:hypothetical protein